MDSSHITIMIHNDQKKAHTYIDSTRYFRSQFLYFILFYFFVTVVLLCCLSSNKKSGNSMTGNLNKNYFYIFL